MENRSIKRLKGKAPVVDKSDRIFVGLDVHKLSVHVAVRINGELHGTAVLPAKPKTVVSFLKPYQAGIRKIVYEAGPTGYGLVRALLKAGFPTAVVAPSKIPRPAVQGAKSDQLDCRKLAEFVEKDLLREVAVPTVQEEEDRQLQRLRDGLVDRRRKAKQRIRGFLLQHSLEEPANLTFWGQEAIEYLQAIHLSKTMRFCLDRLVEDLLHVLDQMQQVKKQLKEMASEERFAEAAKHLKTHPGVGDITCMQVLTELYQPKRFENSKQVAAYVGLAPQVRQSGGTRVEGPLLRGGRGALRSTLVEAAWAWIRVEKKAAKLYGRMVKNTGSGKKAIVAMARRMLVHLWIMLVRKEDYRPLAA